MSILSRFLAIETNVQRADKQTLANHVISIMTVSEYFDLSDWLGLRWHSASRLRRLWKWFRSCAVEQKSDFLQMSARWDRFVYIWRAAVIPVEPVNSSDLKSCRRGADLLVDFEKVIFCPSSYHFSLWSHFHWDIQITENSIWYKNKFHNNCHFESND